MVTLIDHLFLLTCNIMKLGEGMNGAKSPGQSERTVIPQKLSETMTQTQGNTEVIRVSKPD